MCAGCLCLNYAKMLHELEFKYSKTKKSIIIEKHKVVRLKPTKMCLANCQL